MVEYLLALDEPAKEDTIIYEREIMFLANEKTISEVGDYIKISKNVTGLVLINSNQTLAYGVRVKGANTKE
ncbi:hypothetical protein [Bacillus sp. FJAT-45350]|uniref:hypothetical protein n=1 Tax=Bacillus sp. FJAT-45350 TaxID=2011014 RepID=UPI000BB7BE54|nr:hypothetical protein [Bacillus sp. FJAT-45350]